MKEEFKTVAKFNDPIAAEITAGMLRSSGIQAMVFGQASSYPSINATVNALEVKVNAEDFEAAMSLLDSQEPDK